MNRKKTIKRIVDNLVKKDYGYVNIGTLYFDKNKNKLLMFDGMVWVEVEKENKKIS